MTVIQLNFKKLFLIVLSVYIIYAIFFGIAIYYIDDPEISSYLENTNTSKFLGDNKSEDEVVPDEVVLLEEREKSGMARINLIENAEKTLDITSLIIHSGDYSNIYIGSILDAADRGVEVRVILDGLVHSVKSRDIIYTFSAHPNIKIKFYEPFRLSKPWIWNNRLHDKLLLVDGQYALIGGKNIADKFFISDLRGRQIF